jgi:hypothetical protein
VLKRTHLPRYYVAAVALSLIAAAPGGARASRQAVEAGALPRLLRMLGSADHHVQTAGVTALGNIAEHEELAPEVASAGVVPALVALLLRPLGQEVAVAGARVLSIIVDVAPLREHLLMAGVASALVALLRRPAPPGDTAAQEVQMWTVEALMALTDQGCPGKHAVVEAGGLPLLVGLLRQPTVPVLHDTLQVLWHLAQCGHTVSWPVRRPDARECQH